jgi:hypothetical protein
MPKNDKLYDLIISNLEGHNKSIKEIEKKFDSHLARLRETTHETARIVQKFIGKWEKERALQETTDIVLKKEIKENKEGLKILVNNGCFFGKSKYLTMKTFGVFFAAGLTVIVFVQLSFPPAILSNFWKTILKII